MRAVEIPVRHRRRGCRPRPPTRNAVTDDPRRSLAAECRVAPGAGRRRSTNGSSRLVDASHGRNAFYTASSIAPASTPEDVARARRRACCRSRQGRAHRRPGAPSALGHEADRADRRTTRATARPRRRPGSRCAGPTPTRAGSGCSTAGRRCIAAPASSARDRIFFPFSFGPFLGFWTAFDAGCQIGAHCVPGGGMSSQVRLATIEAIGATVVCCTPTYALRLAEVAAADPATARALRDGPVRVVIVAGEPGGSIAGDAPAHRGGLGRAGHRSLRPHRSRPDRLRVLGRRRRAYI